ncbi:MAG: DUF6434 domain-containing protein [Pseudomonadota bacterium]
MTDARPEIATIETGKELRRWYWLKEELLAEAKRRGLKSTGGKFTLLDRIAHHLDTGETVWPGDKPKQARSKFDWHSETLTPDTIITDSYKNSQNVRRFFKSQVGDGFKFNITFMAWMKANTGKTLADAVNEYRRQRDEAAQPGFKTNIAHHNQFNQYTRDFLAAFPGAKLSLVRKAWAAKRALPSETGRHVFDPSDLDLLDPSDRAG